MRPDVEGRELQDVSEVACPFQSENVRLTPDAASATDKALPMASAIGPGATSFPIAMQVLH